MRIGIDIDGVLTDYEKFQLENLSKYYWKFYNKKIINFDDYYSSKVYDATKLEDNIVWNKAMWEYVKEPPRIYASEIIKKLKSEGHKIYIITARSSDISYIENMTVAKMQNIVLDWLRKYDIYYDEIIFSPENKVNIIKEKQINVMIEDKPENINSIQALIPVICFHAAYNANCKGANITRAYNWYDVYVSLQKMSKYGEKVCE